MAWESISVSGNENYLDLYLKKNVLESLTLIFNTYLLSWFYLMEFTVFLYRNLTKENSIS